MISTTPVLEDASAEIKVIRVRPDTDPKQLALSVAEEVRQALARQAPPNVSLHAMGDRAVNQAVKSVAIANGHLAPRGVTLVMHASFEDKKVAEDDDTIRTVQRLRLIAWRIGG